MITSLTEKQARAFLKQPDRKTFPGKRDYALLLLLFDTGMRIAEAVAITRDDVMEDHVIIRKGKGGKSRVVPLSIATALALRDYLLEVEDIPADHPVFISVHDNPLTRHQVWKRFKKYADSAGISNSASPHVLRHTFAKYYLLNGGDLFTLQKILGHETIDMVRRYVDMLNEDIIKQHGKHSPLDTFIDKRRRR